MSVKEPRDDDQELIDAEFTSMVEGLRLDQSEPRTYLDELEDIDQHLTREEKNSYLNAPRLGGIRNSFKNFLATLRRWYRGNNREDDGAAL